MCRKGICVNHDIRPKTLAERLQWMSDNHPGFRADLDAHAERVRHQNARTARSEARTERTDLAANSSFLDANTERGFFHQRRSSTADESGLPDSDE